MDMSEDNKIDYEFVGRREDNKHSIYVPLLGNKQPHANSGSTIGKGFDLKDKTEDSLKRMDIDEDVIQLLKPYFAKKGVEALAFIKEHPLTLNSYQIDHINLKSKEFYTADIAKQYNTASGNTKDFFDLSASQQTAVYSVGFQYGSLSRTPKFLKHAVNGDAKGMYNELNNFGDKHSIRRKAEARLLFNEHGTAPDFQNIY